MWLEAGGDLWRNVVTDNPAAKTLEPSWLGGSESQLGVPGSYKFFPAEAHASKVCIAGREITSEVLA